MIILVPVPKDEPLPFIGLWDTKWNCCDQTMEFKPNGLYLCPKFGNGSWVYEDGVVYFTEGEISYRMILDWSKMEGVVISYESGTIWKLAMIKRRVK